jgi:hypothetical protein
MSRVWLITGGTAALAREISDRGGSAAAAAACQPASSRGLPRSLAPPTTKAMHTTAARH